MEAKVLPPSLASSPGAMTGGFRRMRTASSASFRCAQRNRGVSEWILILACKCSGGCPCPSQLCSTSGLSGLSDAWHLPQRGQLARPTARQKDSNHHQLSELTSQGISVAPIICKSGFAALHDTTACIVIQGPHFISGVPDTFTLSAQLKSISSMATQALEGVSVHSSTVGLKASSKASWSCSSSLLYGGL